MGLPPHICFWTRTGPHSAGESASGSWNERRVLLVKCRLVAASGSHSSMQRVLADARDVSAELKHVRLFAHSERERRPTS